MEKIVCIPTQRYDVLSRKFGRRFVGTLSVDLDGVRYQKWNSEQVIYIFKTVILQRSKGINNPKQIHARILFPLDFWNCRAFDKLLKETFNGATG